MVNLKRTWQEKGNRKPPPHTHTHAPNTMTGELNYNPSVKLNSKPITRTYPAIKGGHDEQTDSE